MKLIKFSDCDFTARAKLKKPVQMNRIFWFIDFRAYRFKQFLSIVEWQLLIAVLLQKHPR